MKMYKTAILRVWFSQNLQPVCVVANKQETIFRILTVTSHVDAKRIDIRIQSVSQHRLDVPPVRLSTVGKRAFPVSGATVWNDLPLHVASAPSLAVFR